MIENESKAGTSDSSGTNSISVNTGTNCTGDISDNIECLDKDGDGKVDMDYIFDVFMGNTS